MTRQDRGSLQHHLAPGSGPEPVARALASRRVGDDAARPCMWLRKDEQPGKPNTDK